MNDRVAVFPPEISGERYHGVNPGAVTSDLTVPLMSTLNSWAWESWEASNPDTMARLKLIFTI